MIFKSICGFKNLFGIHCAGCGGTRMFMALFRLEFYQAFRYNPYIFILLILGILYGIYIIIMKILKKKICIPNIKWLYVFLVIAVLFMILRNISGFEFLLPTEV